MSSRAGVLGAALVALSGCPREEPRVDERDPLIQKLKAEQARLARGPPRQLPPRVDSPLERAVVEGAPPVALTPVTPFAARARTASFAVKALERSQQVKGARAAVSTADAFLKVTLTAMASEPTQVPLAGATVVSGDHSYGLARDAQKLGGGSALGVTLPVGVEVPLVLFFELPQEAVKKGLKLVLPVGDGAVEVALQ